MPDVIRIPQELIDYLFNFSQGKRIYVYCEAERKITEQVSVSYSTLPLLRQDELRKFAGRCWT